MHNDPIEPSTGRSSSGHGCYNARTDPIDEQHPSCLTGDRSFLKPACDMQARPQALKRFPVLIGMTPPAVSAVIENSERYTGVVTSIQRDALCLQCLAQGFEF